MFERFRDVLADPAYGIMLKRAPGQGITEYGLILILVAFIAAERILFLRALNAASAGPSRERRSRA